MPMKHIEHPREMLWIRWTTWQHPSQGETCSVCRNNFWGFHGIVTCDDCNEVVHLICLIRHMAQCWRKKN